MKMRQVNVSPLCACGKSMATKALAANSLDSEDVPKL